MRKALQTVVRDFVLRAFVFQPLAVRRWLMSHFQRPLLKLLFSLNSEAVTLSPAGLPPHRFRMWLHWQGSLAYALGLYEPEAMQSIRRLVKAGDCCIDVGANLGYYTISLANWVGPSGLVVAFEPFPGNFAILEKNVLVNQVQNVVLESSAISDCNGSLQLIYEENEQFSATPSVAGYAVGEGRECIRVQTRSLDDYIRGLGRVPDFIKIDVEGQESAVLEGARRTLATVKPVLLVEIHGWGTGESEKVLHLLSEFHYDVHLVGRKGHERVALCIPRNRTLPSAALPKTPPSIVENESLPP
jgi:FkbM family methyltransferase